MISLISLTIRAHTFLATANTAPVQGDKQVSRPNSALNEGERAAPCHSRHQQDASLYLTQDIVRRNTCTMTQVARFVAVSQVRFATESVRGSPTTQCFQLRSYGYSPHSLSPQRFPMRSLYTSVFGLHFHAGKLSPM